MKKELVSFGFALVKQDLTQYLLEATLLPVESSSLSRSFF